MSRASRDKGFTLELPYPPSVNSMYRNVAGIGRVKSSKYNKWLAIAREALREQAKGYIGGPVLLHIGAERKYKTADLDNLIKPVLDFLVSQGLIDDDKHVQALSIRWEDVEGVQVTVEKVA